MYNDLEARKLSSGVYKGYVSMRYSHPVSFYCYFGLKPLVNGDSLVKLYSEFDIIYNLIFNFGFIWTDLIMLSLGKPGETESDYAYYMSFYGAELVMRFLFRQTASGYCWLPWNNCETFVSQNLSIDVSS